MEETRRVVEALMRVGPRYTDISRATGIPISTVRYILLKRFPKLGLTVRASINYGALGLQRYLVEFRSRYPPHYISRILDLLGESAYLDYYTYSMNKRRFFALFAIPPSYEESFMEFIQMMGLLGLLDDINIRKLHYMHLLPFMSEFFDFSRGVWIQNWVTRRIEREIQEVPEYPDPNPKVDSIDLMILAELQKQVIPLKYNRFAQKFKLSRQTISKHFEHARNLIKLFAVAWFPFKNPELMVSPLLIETDYEENIRKILLCVPFTYAEMRSEGDKYFAFLWTPSLGQYTTLKFVTESIRVNEVHFQDMEYSGKFSLQYQLYKNRSWMNPFEDITQKLLEISQKKNGRSVASKT